MKAVLKIAINNIKKKKLQSILSLLIIMVAAALLSISLNLLSSVNKPFQEMHEKLNGFDESIAINPNKENLNRLVDLFKDDNRVKSVQVSDFYSGGNEPKVNGEELKEEYIIDEKEDKNEGIDKLITLEGDTGKSPKTGEVWLAKSIADDGNIKVNDEVNFYIAGKKITKKIGAIVVDPSYGSSMSICRFWVKKGEISKMVPKKDIIKNIKVTFKKCGDGNDVNLSIENKLGRPIIGSSAKYSLIKYGFTGTFKMIGGILIAIAAFILVFTLIIVIITITSLIFNDYKNIGIESSMGFTKLQIIVNYMSTFFIISIIGSLLGVFIGNIFSSVYMQNFYTNLGFAKVSIPIFRTSIITMIIIGMFIIISSFIASISILKISPVEAIRNGKSPVKEKRKNGVSLMSMKKLDLNFTLAIKDLFSNVRQNLFLLLLIGTAVYITAFSINTRQVFNTIGKNSGYWGFERSDISLVAKNNISKQKIVEDIKDIRKYEEVSKVCNYYEYWTPTPKTNKLPSSSTMAFAYDLNFNDIGLENIKGKNPTKDDEITISDKLSEKYKKGIGDYYTIYINGVKRSFLITGIFQNPFNNGENLKIKSSVIDKLDDNFKNVIPTQTSIIIKNKANVSKVLSRLKEKYNNNYYIEEGNQYLENRVGNDFKVANQPLVLVIISFSIIAVFCIFNFNLINIYAYKKTLGIYKGMGFTNIEIIKIYVYKILFITMSSIIIFLPIEKCTQNAVIGTMLSSIGIKELPLPMCIGQIIASLIAFIILILLAVIISCRLISQINTRDLVSE